MSDVIMFTDGASKGNPGNGGWGAIIVLTDQKVIELGGFSAQVTNNQMELKAIICGLQYIQSCKTAISKLKIYTDSQYAIHGITSWIHTWIKKSWINSQGMPVLNKELWQTLYTLTRDKQYLQNIEWIHVRGHQGIAGNERADTIASDFAEQKNPPLYSGSLSDYSHDLMNVAVGHSQNKQAKSLNRSKKKAYSYLSSIDGELKIHQTWAECEARVKGRRGARFRKSLSADDEAEIIRQWTASEAKHPDA